MTETPLGRLRGAIRDAAALPAGADAGRLIELGRPLWTDAATLATEPWTQGVAGASGGLAWGAPRPEALDGWIGAVRSGGVLACVIAVARPGPRGVLDRLALLPSRVAPSSLEDLCTALFVGGVGSLRVYPIEPRRNLVVVVGVRRAT